MRKGIKTASGPHPAAVALLAVALLAGGTAAADCPPGYAMQQKALLDADYSRQAMDIAAWRDQQFRYALDQFNAEYGTGAKQIYARLNAEKAQLGERIRTGDLRQSKQKQRSDAAQEIGARFRADITALLAEVRERYRAQLARTRADVAAMRQATAEFYAEDRQALRDTIADGCRKEFRIRLRSVFLFVSGLMRGPPKAEPDDRPIGFLGIRG